ncbi:hypothetical protein, unknown function [Leishmania tarentolae]|uniref:Uncharacterized protein n=1 Tax=Leishmania tarentolae TaxID=5689 RepID=A0A640KK58_LEITA|nr:hypothetical protein, unknown function [Leishmania tarentolae]
MITCRGAAPRAVLSAILLCGLVAEVAFTTPLRSTEYADRIAAVTCCERIETAWPILRSWSRTCANEQARGDATVKRFATMLAAHSRSSAPALTFTKVCRGKHLSREAVQAFFEHAFCSSLPITHTDLVYSAYSTLMDDAPHDEDALTSSVAVACQRLQQRWTVHAQQWEELLVGRYDLADAQSGLCPRSCTWTTDKFAGDVYDL